MIPTRLVFIPASADLPAPVVVVGADGAVAPQPDLTLESAPELAPMRTLAIAPGADVLIRRLVLPVGPAAQVRAAALWNLRRELAAPAERLSVALGAAARDSEPRVVAVVAVALVQAWSDYLASLGIRPEAIVPANLILPPPLEPDVVSRRDMGPDVILRGSDLAVATQVELADLVIGDRRVDRVDDIRWGRALATLALAPPLDLRVVRSGGAGASRKGWAWAAVLAAAVLLSPLLLAAAGGLRDEAVARDAKRQTAAMIAAAAPDQGGAADSPAQFLDRSAADLPRGVGQASAALFTAIEAVEGGEIDALSFEPTRGLSATVSYPAFQDLDALRTTMANAGYDVHDDSTVEDGGRIVSGVLIRRGQ